MKYGDKITVVPCHYYDSQEGRLDLRMLNGRYVSRSSSLSSSPEAFTDAPIFVVESGSLMVILTVNINQTLRLTSPSRDRRIERSIYLRTSENQASSPPESIRSISVAFKAESLTNHAS